MTIKELKDKMCIPADASKEYIEQTFESIAEIFKNGCVIKYNKDEYRFLDFEFYFFNINHQDISVHPRISDALCWYINDFGGIDLNFESNIIQHHVVKNKKLSFKYKLTDDSYFGGILIRQLQRLSDKMVYDGPYKVAELFRTLDATSQRQNNPILVMKQIESIGLWERKKRHNLLGSQKDAKAKANYNIQECFIGITESKKHDLEVNLSSFVESEYRYLLKNI